MTSGRRETRENGNSGPTHTLHGYFFSFPSCIFFLTGLFKYAYCCSYVTSSLLACKSVVTRSPSSLNYLAIIATRLNFFLGGVVSCARRKKMSFNKHSVRLFVMQRNTLHQIAPGTANYRKYDTRLHQGRYLSTEVLPEEEQSGLFGKKLNERQRAAREKFLEAEKEWDKMVKWDSLNEDEIEIVTAHKRAVLCGHFTYDDTKIGKKVDRKSVV